MGEDTPFARKPRADQARNRDRLLTAARDVFRSDAASLEAVARRAGLGIATQVIGEELGDGGGACGRGHEGGQEDSAKEGPPGRGTGRTTHQVPWAGTPPWHVLSGAQAPSPRGRATATRAYSFGGVMPLMKSLSSAATT